MGWMTEESGFDSGMGIMKQTTYLHLVPSLIMWRAVSTSPYVFTAWSLIKHQDNYFFSPHKHKTSLS
jgi:hypothetical protein